MEFFLKQKEMEFWNLSKPVHKKSACVLFYCSNQLRAVVLCLHFQAQMAEMAKRAWVTASQPI